LAQAAEEVARRKVEKLTDAYAIYDSARTGELWQRDAAQAAAMMEAYKRSYEADSSWAEDVARHSGDAGLGGDPSRAAVRGVSDQSQSSLCDLIAELLSRVHAGLISERRWWGGCATTLW
jgi:hypothetical protein